MKTAKPDKPPGSSAIPVDDGRLPKLITRKETTLRDLFAVLVLVVLSVFLVSHQNHLNEARRQVERHGTFIDSLRIEVAKLSSAPSDLAAQQGRLNALQDRVRTLETGPNDGSANVAGEGDE